LIVEISLNKEEIKELGTFCEVNGLDICEFIKKCYVCGFNIEKYGLFGETKSDNTNELKDKILELENKIIYLDEKLQASIKKRKMLEETILNLKGELAALK